MYYIYKLNLGDSGKYYIGMTQDPKQRLLKHRSMAMIGKHDNPNINLHYEEGMKISMRIMDGTEDKDLALEIETALTKLALDEDSDNCLNVKYGDSGYKHDDNAKAKMSAIHKGKTITEEQKEKLRNNEKLIRIRAENKLKQEGVAHDAEHKRKVSEALKGRQRPQDQIDRMKATMAANGPRDHDRSDVIVRYFVDDQEYTSITKAADEFGLHRSSARKRFRKDTWPNWKMVRIEL